MASLLKRLAGQTAVYGLSGMVGRFLNYLLVPLHTAQFVPSEYGVVTDVYSLAAFGAVLLTWGLETGYFRFSNNPANNPDDVLKNILGFMLYSGLLFIAVLLVFTDDLASALLYPDNPEYILWMGFALVFDASAAIPLARLRLLEKPVKFAVIQIISISVNIGLNILFIGFILPAGNAGENGFLTELLYHPAIGVGYIFIANLIASAVKFLLTAPVYFKAALFPDKKQLKELFIYSSPLMLAGFAGMINEILDRRLIRIILEPVIGKEAALTQVGIYGAVYKLSIIITLFIQAFRYAAEPLFFSQSTKSDAKQGYVEITKWFTIITAFVFLLVMLYLDFFKHFIAQESYHVGLHIVPILLTANIFLGLSYNFSVWYKLTNKTNFGAYLAIFGAVITISLNFLLVPQMGYTGSAYATLAAYGGICIVSYFLGQKYYPVPYNLKSMFGYLAGAWFFYLVSTVIPVQGGLKYIVNTGLFFIFAVLTFWSERKTLSKFLM